MQIESRHLKVRFIGACKLIAFFGKFVMFYVSCINDLVMNLK